jgi:hypothetical protein
MWDLNSISSIVQAVCSIILAGIAFAALFSWKAQKKADIKIDLLNELLNCFYDLDNSLRNSINDYKNIRIFINDGLKQNILDMGNDYKDTESPEILYFIDHVGASMIASFKNNLEMPLKKIIMIRTMLNKMNALGFQNSKYCKDAVEKYTKVFSLLDDCAQNFYGLSMYRNGNNKITNLKFHIDLEKFGITQMKNLLEHSEEKLVKELDIGNEKINEFAKVNYCKIF